MLVELELLESGLLVLATGLPPVAGVEADPRTEQAPRCWPTSTLPKYALRESDPKFPLSLGVLLEAYTWSYVSTCNQPRAGVELLLVAFVAVPDKTRDAAVGKNAAVGKHAAVGKLSA